jgi:hypothetical protein
MEQFLGMWLALCLVGAYLVGAEVVHEFIDRGESARSADRPGLISMLTYLKDARGP